MPFIAVSPMQWAFQHNVYARDGGVIDAGLPRESASDLVNEAVKLSLGEDAEDFAALKARTNEPSMSFESMVADLQRRGKL